MPISLIVALNVWPGAISPLFIILSGLNGFPGEKLAMPLKIL